MPGKGRTFTLRDAFQSDADSITELIHRVNINPTGLDWRRFIVAVDEAGRLVGCGQMKPHRDGTRELASIAVQPERQGQGIGHALIERLLTQNPRPLYLMCRANLEPYYRKFHFQVVNSKEMPRSYRFIWYAARTFHLLFPRQFPGLRIMVLRKEP